MWRTNATQHVNSLKGMEGVVDACSAKANPEHQHLEHPYVRISTASPYHSPCDSVKVVRL